MPSFSLYLYDTFLLMVRAGERERERAQSRNTLLKISVVRLPQTCVPKRRYSYFNREILFSFIFVFLDLCGKSDLPKYFSSSNSALLTIATYL